MDINHDTLVETAKTWGLFYLIGFSIGDDLHVSAVQQATLQEC